MLGTERHVRPRTPEAIMGLLERKLRTLAGVYFEAISPSTIFFPKKLLQKCKIEVIVRSLAYFACRRGRH